MTMLYVLLQKPLNHGQIVKALDRLLVFSAVHKHLEFSSFVSLFVLFPLAQSFPTPSHQGSARCFKVSSE